MRGVTPDQVLAAYMSGIFPMAESRDSQHIFWVEPESRGILPLDRFHLSRSLARTLRKAPFAVTVDKAFERVIRACGSARAGRDETWINARIIDLFATLHHRGFAHSVECRREGRLVGGIYGVAIGTAFFGESMFHFEPDASKVALAYLVARLSAGGYQLFDLQWLTDHLARLGAIEISREDYRARLETALKAEGDFGALPYDSPPSRILQLITQTS